MVSRALLGCLFLGAALACSSTDSGGATAHAGAGGASAGSPTSLAGAPSSSAGATGKSSGGAPSSAGSSSTTGGSGVVGKGGGGGAVSSGSGGAVSSGGSPVTGAAGQKSTPIPVKDLPVIKEMPDPLTMKDGTKVTTPEQWKLRRQEMIQILEDYEYGHMPPPPGNVKATTATALERVTVNSSLEADYRMLHLTFGPNDKLGFDLGLFTPVGSTQTKFAVLISLTSTTDEKSLSSASVALSRGYAVATVPYQKLGADSSAWKSSGFFPSYPEYDWRDISAWAWGLSRAVDYLVTDAAIDANKIMITGVSRLAQAVLLAGAFDERIALSAPVAGGAAFRYSGKEMAPSSLPASQAGQGITEVVDQNTYWFGPRLIDFRNQTPKLPSDQHWLPALTAPRLFIMCNSLSDQYGRAYAAVQTYLNAKPVYQFLGADQNLGQNFRAGSHGMTSEDWSALLDFADQFLLKKAGTRKFDVLPPADKTP